MTSLFARSPGDSFPWETPGGHRRPAPALPGRAGRVAVARPGVPLRWILLALHVLAIALLSGVAVSLRAGNLPALQETYALDNDSYRFLRLAEAEVAGRPIYPVDRFRWRPEGRDMRTHLRLHAIVMARVYRVASRLGMRLPFRAFALRYSLLCYLLCLWIVYVALARASTPLAGLVAAAGMATAPATLARSAAGFVDRDSFCLLLALCACVAYAAFRARSAGAAAGAAVLCALFSAALGLAWEGVGLVTVLFAVTLAWMAMSGRLTARLLALHLLWCAIALPPLLLATHAYRDLIQPSTGLALVPVPFACLSALLAAGGARLRRDLSARPVSPAARFAAAAALLGAAGAATAVLCLPHAGAAAAAFVDSAISTLGSSRLMRSVAELRVLYGADWWTIFGASLALFLLGVESVANELAGGRRRGILLGLATVGYSVAVIGSNGLAHVLGRLPVLSPLEHVLAGSLRLAALALWFVLAVLLSAPREGRPPADPEMPRFSLLAAWVLLLAVTAGAERYAFLLAAAGWIAAGYGFAQIAARGEDPHTGRIQMRAALALVAALGVCLCLAGLAPLQHLLGGARGLALGLAVAALAGLLLARAVLAEGAGHARAPAPPRRAAIPLLGMLALVLALGAARCRATAAATGPGLAWLSSPLEALDHRLPPHAVVLAWWDAGSHINVLARRATVIDEDHFIPERIEEVAREVYAGTDPERALRCLARLGVTHWLLTDLDLTELPVQAWIGAGTGHAPPPRIYRFTGAGEIAGGGLTLSLPRAQILEDPLAVPALGPGGPVRILALRITPPVGQVPGAGAPAVEIELSAGARRARVEPARVLFRGRSIAARGPALPGTVVLRDVAGGGRTEAVYVPPLAGRCLSVRLACLGERFPMFRPVAAFETPPEAGGAAAHRVAVWEVVY